MTFPAKRTRFRNRILLSERARRLVAACLAAGTAALLGFSSALLGTCGPFADVAADAFCPFVLEIFTLGITTGTTPTAYDPGSSVTRLQMAAFLSRTVDGVLRRGSPRTALGQFWTPRDETVVPVTALNVNDVEGIQSDGADLWIASEASVLRVRASDGKLLETWTHGADTTAGGLLIAMGRVLVPGYSGKLYMIDPTQPAGAVTTVATNLGNGAHGITFDGARIWTANTGGSVSIVTPTAALPWTVTTVSAGFSTPYGNLFDGANVWVTDIDAGTLLKLDSSGGILQTVTVGISPYQPVFDGTNIWVPNNTHNTPEGTVTVVRASSGTVLRTLTGNGLLGPRGGAFDGERILITNANGVSLWKASDLTPLGWSGVGSWESDALYACSDDGNFWIGLNADGALARF